MNYNYLLYFSVLAQTEHYTIAADRLGISQPALSSAIRHLENTLGGVKLFEKAGRNIRLTDEGRFYQEAVDTAIKELNKASVLLRDSRIMAPVVIRMGFVSGTLNGVLAREIAAYAKSNKRIRFHLTESASENLKDLVRQEKLDMAIVDSSDRDRSLHFRKLSEQSFFVALPDTHPLAQRKTIEPQEVALEPQVVFHHNAEKRFREWVTGASAEEVVVCTVDTASAALDLVSARVGIAFIPRECTEARPGVQYVPLQNLSHPLYMCTLNDKWLEPLIWDFVELAVKAFRSKRQVVKKGNE